MEIRLEPIAETVHADQSLHINAKKLIDYSIPPKNEEEEGEGRENKPVGRLRTIAESLRDIRRPKIDNKEADVIKKINLG